jgi:hypothetical protein
MAGDKIKSKYKPMSAPSIERRFGDVEHPLPVSLIREELSLRFEKLNKNSNKDNCDNSEEMAFYGGQFRVKCRNCGKIGHK